MSGSNFKKAVVLSTAMAAATLSGAVDDALATYDEGCGGDHPSSNCNQPENTDIDTSSEAKARAEAAAIAAINSNTELSAAQKQEMIAGLTANQNVKSENTNNLSTKTGDIDNDNKLSVDDHSKTTYKTGAGGNAPDMDIADNIDECASSESTTGSFWLVFGGGISGGHSVVNAAGVTFPDGTKLPEYINGTKAVRSAALASAGFSDGDLRALGCIEKRLVEEDSKHDDKLLDMMVRHKLGIDNNGNRDTEIEVTKIGKFNVEGIVAAEVPEYKEGMSASMQAYKSAMIGKDEEGNVLKDENGKVQIVEVTELSLLLELFAAEEAANDTKPPALEAPEAQ